MDTAPAPAPNPAVGIGILVLRHGRVLLGRRLGAHGAGQWAAPGGKLEFGESFEDCAERELAEETGLSLGPTEFAGVCNDVFDAPPAHYVTVMLLARATGGEPVNAEPHKCAGWQWFDWDALPEPLFAPLATLMAGGWRPDDACGDQQAQ
ncbi:MAG: NUDIX domain-containing protein [Burkholderiaceae bacterium]|nr:NUDIX domain-containing protein [Burkholderiaceae bacterium]